MDQLDIQLLKLVQLDGRLTISELSKKLALSRPSVTERLRRLEDKGIIEGFSARLSPSAVGRTVLAFMQLSDIKIPYVKFEQMIKEDPDILECHRVSGTVSYLLKAAVPGVEGLTNLVDRLIPCGNVNTSIVLSSPLPYRIINPIAAN
jgi:Lrp/AsnC family leucine-responsive transcriptional regulator